MRIPPWGNCRDCQGIMGELQGLFRVWGDGKDSLLCGGIARTSLHRGIVVDPCGKQVEHVQVELKHIKSH